MCEKMENGYGEEDPELTTTCTSTRELIMPRSSITCPLSKNHPTFSELAVNTNINSPPPNWLQGSFGVREPWVPGGSTGANRDHSSFVMADSYLDNVGKVDVIADAENIKSLLKIPYSKAPISMMVHRVGKTLLIDNFDVYSRILKLQQSDWKWLQSFMSEQICQLEQEIHPTENLSQALSPRSSRALVPLPPMQTRDAVMEKLMLSKFLYHSITSAPSSADDGSFDVRNSPSSCVNFRKRASSLPDPLECQPIDDELKTRPHELPSFEREMLWTFEDIRMLIGSDMPIFGRGKRPCVSLRLRDMRKPINILTGLDYWLDNLMCNVPEVVMCYHLEGIVQKYELIKTEDLPNLSETPFSSELIRDVAQNILSFLKSNATKEGHTYWLFKAKDDDVVKLYDLTTLCPEHVDNSDANPFTLPVAVLMYKVAKNLISKNERALTKASNTIYKLLNDCLELLSKEKNPQVVGSVHYLLANLYISCAMMNAPLGAGQSPAGGGAQKVDSTNQNGPVSAHCAKQFPGGEGDEDPENYLEVDEYSQLDDSDFDQSDWFHEDRTGARQNGPEAGSLPCVSLDFLMMPPERSQGMNLPTPAGQPGRICKPIPNCSNFEDCCKEALEHIYEGLECAEVVERYREKLNGTGSGTDIVPGHSDGPRAVVDPKTPIPLQYQPIYDSRVVPLSALKPLATTWQLELTALVLTKGMSAYHLLAECSVKLFLWGKALRYVRLAVLCFESARHLVTSAESLSSTLKQVQNNYDSLLPHLLQLCGGIHLELAQEGVRFAPKHKADYMRNVYRDTTISNKAWKILGGEKTKLAYAELVEFEEGAEKNHILSIKCFEAALDTLRQGNSAIFSASGKTKKSGSGDGAQTGGGSPKKSAQNRINFQSFVGDSISASRKLGSAKNELALYYMRLSELIVRRGEVVDNTGSFDADKLEAEEPVITDNKTGSATESGSTDDSSTKINERVMALWAASAGAFAEGIALFKKINDKANEALLNSNFARLMRLCAHAYSDPDRQFQPEERGYLEKALERYQLALECVSQKHSRPIWETIVWEYSSALFTFATQLQERPPTKLREVDEIEREIGDLMQKSLKLVEQLNSPDSVRRDIYVLRQATIHHKLGSMYNQSYMTKTPANDRLRKISELHYGKSYALFKDLVSDCPLELLRVQLERVAMLEYAAAYVSQSDAAKQSLYCQALKKCLDIDDVFKVLAERVKHTSCGKELNRISGSGSPGDDSGSTSSAPVTNEFLQEARKLCEMTLDRIQNFLMTILKLLRAVNAKKASNLSAKTKEELFRDAYKATLSAPKPSQPADWPKYLLTVIDSLNSAFVNFNWPMECAK